MSGGRIPLVLLLVLLAVPLAAANRYPGTCAVSDRGDPGPARAVLVLIIDDIGYQWDQGLAAIALPGRVNLAVLPFTPHGRSLAERAHLRGDKELLLHAPMSNLTGKALGPGALTPALDRQAFRQTLEASLADIPHVRGVNNHMGSDLTRRRLQMQWLMELLDERQLYFIDSRTNRETVAANVARERRLPHLSREVFLDNLREPAAIAARFQALVDSAMEDGLAVGIGHPYPETLAFLARELPALRTQGLRLALISEVLYPREADRGPKTRAPGQLATGRQVIDSTMPLVPPRRSPAYH